MPQAIKLYDAVVNYDLYLKGFSFCKEFSVPTFKKARKVAHSCIYFRIEQVENYPFYLNFANHFL